MLVEKKEYKTQKSDKNRLPLNKPLQFGNYDTHNIPYIRVSTDSWVDEIIYSKDLIKTDDEIIGVFLDIVNKIIMMN